MKETQCDAKSILLMRKQRGGNLFLNIGRVEKFYGIGEPQVNLLLGWGPIMFVISLPFVLWAVQRPGRVLQTWKQQGKKRAKE